MHLKKYNITVASYTYTMSYVASLKMTLLDVMMIMEVYHNNIICVEKVMMLSQFLLYLSVACSFLMNLLYIFQASAKTIMATEMVKSGKRTAKRGVKTFTDTSVMLFA